jgi:hypothetical protein
MFDTAFESLANENHKAFKQERNQTPPTGQKQTTH